MAHFLLLPYQLAKVHNAVTFQILHCVITSNNVTCHNIVLLCIWNIITMLTYVCNILGTMTHRW